MPPSTPSRSSTSGTRAWRRATRTTRCGCSCHSHRDTVKLAEQLEAEGLRCVRRWHYLLLGANDEDDANALAERLRREAPEGSTITVEGNLLEVYEEGPQNPFAFLGGLGG